MLNKLITEFAIQDSAQVSNEFFGSSNNSSPKRALIAETTALLNDIGRALNFSYDRDLKLIKSTAHKLTIFTEFKTGFAGSATKNYVDKFFDTAELVKSVSNLHDAKLFMTALKKVHKYFANDGKNIAASAWCKARASRVSTTRSENPSNWAKSAYSDCDKNFKEMSVAILRQFKRLKDVSTEAYAVPSTEMYTVEDDERETVQGQGKRVFNTFCYIRGQATNALKEAYDKIKRTTKKLPDGSVIFMCGWDSQLEKILTTKLKPYFVGMKELKEVTPYSIKHYKASNSSIDDYFTDNLGYSKTKFEKHLAKRTIHKVNPKDPTTFPDNFIKRMKQAEAVFLKQIDELQRGIKHICKF